MATLTIAGVAAVLNLMLMDSSEDQFRRDVLLPNLLEVKEGRNETCTWPVKFTGRNTAGPKAEGHDAGDSDFSSHNRKRGSLAWAEYFSYAKVSGISQAIAAANGGGGLDVDLLREEVQDAIDELAVSISADIYAGDVTSDPPEIEGLARAVDSTGTYAGLAQGTYAEWASGEQTLAEGDLSIDNLRVKLHRPFKDATGQWPEFVLCDGATWDKVSALFTENNRQIVDVVRTRARGAVDLKGIAGCRVILVDGVPYIEDRHATANTLYALHSKFVHIEQVPGAVSTMDPHTVIQAMETMGFKGVREDEALEIIRAATRRLIPTIEPLDKTGDNAKVMVKLYLQLCLKRRNAAAKLTLTS